MLIRRLWLFVFLVLVVCGVTSCGSDVASHPVAGAGWVSQAPAARSGASGSGSNRPNVVFVLTDDLSWNLVRYMPHVVAMERHGLTFARYFVTDSLCCPSRTSIYTGQFPHNSGVFSNTGPGGGFSAFLAHKDEKKTFATVLQSRGYQTGFFGKFLNGYNPAAASEGQRPYIPPGWSAWAAADRHGYAEYGYHLAVGREVGSYGSGPRSYLTSVLSTKASQFIAAASKAKQPFFAEVSTFSPHRPFVPAPTDLTKFGGVQAPQTPAFGRAVRHAPGWLAKVPPLTAAAKSRLNKDFRLRVRDVQSVDRMIAHLENEIRALGVANNTYFVFSSDNGLHLGEHDLRRGKQTAFDTDINVPLIVTGPGVPAGKNTTDLTQNIDLAPTFESIAGGTPSANVDGHSLLGLLHGVSPPSWRTAVLIEHHGQVAAHGDPDFQPVNAGDPPSYEAMRTNQYLYVEYKTGQREYYDLIADPNELNNRYAQLTPKFKRTLHQTLAKMKACHASTACWTAQHLSPIPSTQ